MKRLRCSCGAKSIKFREKNIVPQNGGANLFDYHGDRWRHILVDMFDNAQIEVYKDCEGIVTVEEVKPKEPK